MAASWHRAIYPHCCGRQGGLGWGKPQRRRELWNAITWIGIWPAHGVKWDSSAWILLFARMKKFTHHLQYKWESSRSSCGWPWRVLNKENWSLLMKLELQWTWRIFMLITHLKNEENEPWDREVTYTRSSSAEVEDLGLDFRNFNFKSYLVFNFKTYFPPTVIH